MRSLLGVGVVMAVVVGGGALSYAEIQVETFTSRSAFVARLGNVTVIDFDDVGTSGDAAVPIPSDRYAAQGVIINGQGGQFVSRTFGDPANFPPFSEEVTFA